MSMSSTKMCMLLALLQAVSGVSLAEPIEPAGPHQQAAEAHAGWPVAADHLNAITTAIVPLQPRAAGTGPCATIFGYLPYWESAANLRYDLLTHLACFSVEAKGDGTLGNLHGWPWTSTINAAHTAGVKIILVTTLFDATSIDTLISTPSYKNAFFSNIRASMLAGSADGLNIDFEGNGAWRSRINAFMAELTAYIHAQIPGSEVTFAGPAVNWSNGWDLAGLAASCDGIFIMGYAFYGSWSTSSGPEAPLTGGSYNITNTVTVQYAQVTQNHPEKLILGLPYYGEHWTTQSSAARSSVISYVGSTRFRDTQTQSQTYGLLWDAASQTPWYRWQVGTTWHQVWADNAESLGLKYGLARQHGLQGVGMWALNYDGTRPELWDELNRQFRLPCLPYPDFNRDGDVDAEDFGHLQRCLTGIGIPQAEPACADARLDDDLDVDEFDYAIFAECLTAPGVHAATGCTSIQ